MYSYIRGRLVDRVAADGRLAPVQQPMGDSQANVGALGGCCLLHCRMGLLQLLTNVPLLAALPVLLAPSSLALGVSWPAFLLLLACLPAADLPCCP